MKSQLAPFERQFTDADLLLFEQLTDGLVGHIVTGYDPLYGGAFSIHLGAPVLSASGKERGTWIVTGWGCDLVVQTEQQSVDGRIEGREPAREHLKMLAGVRLERLSLERETLSLLLYFESGTQVQLLSDPDFEGSAWILSRPTGETIAADANGFWRLENDGTRPPAQGG